MKNLAGEINIQMKDLESRLRTSFNKSLEIDATRNNTFELQIESKIDNINKELLSKIESIENQQVRHVKNNKFVYNTDVNEERLSEIEAKLR